MNFQTPGGERTRVYESYELTGKGLAAFNNGVSAPVMLPGTTHYEIHRAGLTGVPIVAVPESIRKIEAEEAARLEARKAEMKAAFAEAGVSVDSVPLDQLAAQSGRQKT